MRRDVWFWAAVAGGGIVAWVLLRQKERYAPGSTEQVALFTSAAFQAGVPTSWASSSALIGVLKGESDGWVGQPNYTYGARSRDHSLWPSVWAELKAGQRTTSSSATGLGQLILENVDRYYPGGRAGIGNATAEAVGMLRYIKDRYGSPEAAYAYGMRGGSWGGY